MIGHLSLGLNGRRPPEPGGHFILLQRTNYTIKLFKFTVTPMYPTLQCTITSESTQI